MTDICRFFCCGRPFQKGLFADKLRACPTAGCAKMQSGLSRRYFLSSLGALSAAALLPRAAQAVFIDADRNGDRCTNSGSTLSLNRGSWIDSLGGPGGYTDDTSTPLSQTALADAVKSGLSAVNLTVSGVGSYARNYDETIKNIAYWNAEIAKHSDRLAQVRSVADLQEAHCAGKLGLIYGFQDATPMGEDLDRVD